MALSVTIHHQQRLLFNHACCISSSYNNFHHHRRQHRNGVQIRASKASSASIEVAATPTYPLFQAPEAEETLTAASLLEPADPDFYKIGYMRSVRAYGIEFKEGPDGFGVYASKDVEPLRRARVIMEIPLELMLTISKKVPWMFFPDVVPIGHPIFDIINSTDPETDWDLRLACLLLYAFDRDDNFWQLYGDFLPSADECTSLLLATKAQISTIHMLVARIEKLAVKVRDAIFKIIEMKPA